MSQNRYARTVVQAQPQAVTQSPSPTRWPGFRLVLGVHPSGWHLIPWYVADTAKRTRMVGWLCLSLTLQRHGQG